MAEHPVQRRAHLADLGARIGVLVRYAHRQVHLTPGQLAGGARGTGRPGDLDVLGDRLPAAVSEGQQVVPRGGRVEAIAYLNYLASPQARDTWKKYGFLELK